MNKLGSKKDKYWIQALLKLSITVGMYIIYCQSWMFTCMRIENYLLLPSVDSINMNN